jgi:hypothetical protein
MKQCNVIIKEFCFAWDKGMQNRKVKLDKEPIGVKGND